MHCQEDLFTLLAQVVGSLKQIESGVLSPCFSDLKCRVFDVEPVCGEVILLQQIDNNISQECAITRLLYTSIFLHVNLLMGGLPVAAILMDISSPSITEKFPGEELNSGGTENVYMR